MCLALAAASPRPDFREMGRQAGYVLAPFILLLIAFVVVAVVVSRSKRRQKKEEEAARRQRGPRAGRERPDRG